MKNISLRLILVSTLLWSVASCINTNGIDDNGTSEADLRAMLLEETELMALFPDGTSKKYDKTTEQVVYNSGKTLYMVSTMDYSTQYTLTFSGDLLLDGEVVVNYKSNNIEEIESGTANMSVLKIDTTDKRYWLWDSELCIGFIVDFDI